MKKLNFLPIASVRSRILSISYRSRIDPVSIPYQSRINPVLFPYRPSFFLLSPSFVVLSFSLPEAETIRKPCGIDTETIGGTKKEQGRRKEERRVRTSYSDWFHSPVFRWRRSPLCSTLLPPHRVYLHRIYLFAQKSL